MGISSQKAPQQIAKNPPPIMLSTPWATFKAIAKNAKPQAQRLSPNRPPPTMICTIAAIRPIAPCQAAWLPNPTRRSAPSQSPRVAVSAPKRKANPLQHSERIPRKMRGMPS